MSIYKKLLLFIVLTIGVIGAGCSLGWTAYLHEWTAFAGSLVVIAFAIPTWVKHVKKLWS